MQSGRTEYGMVRRFEIGKTSKFMAFIDLMENGDIMLHELFSDFPKLNPGNEYDYHVTFSLRGKEQVRKLKEILNNEWK